MSPLPLPRRIGAHLNLEGPANRSLLFDKGLATYSAGWGLGGEDKKAFLTTFVGRFRGDIRSLRERRRHALAALGARSVDLKTASRLVIGLGLPHPLETGFLFDRLSGCPFLPGSSVKGLLRAAARLVRANELPGEKEYWTEEKIRRLFGPEAADPAGPARGTMTFYDAFPVEWPKLEVDVLTPHYGDYYRDAKEPPGDWEGPVPVPFLTTKAGTVFRFSFRSAEDGEQRKQDETAIERLLPTALEWLGIGGKKSSGYGSFEEQETEVPHGDVARQGEPARPRPETWAGACLTWAKDTGRLKATNGRLRAESSDPSLTGQIPESVLETLKRGKKQVRADVVVELIGGTEFRILKLKVRT